MKMKKAKFVEINEIVKPGKYADKIIGIELQRTKDIVSILGVGKSNWDDIDIHDVDPKAYNFKVIDRERVHHLFSVASKEQEREVASSEIALMNSRRNLKFCQNKVKEYFGKPVEIMDGDLK